MTLEEAKLILQACRPGGEDSADPQVVAALKLASNDPELMACLKEQRAFDAMISSKLEQVPVPPGLEAKIMAATRRPHAARPRWNTAYLAWAASIVILASVLLLWPGRSRPGAGSDLSALRTHLTTFLREFPRLDLETDRWPEINEWLAQKTTLEIPPQLKDYPGLGCRELRWKEKRLFLICFVAQGEVVHLFLLPNSDLSGPTPLSTPTFAQVKGWSAANWAQGEASYVVLTKGSEAFLKNLLTNRNRG